MNDKDLRISICKERIENFCQCMLCVCLLIVGIGIGIDIASLVVQDKMLLWFGIGITLPSLVFILILSFLLSNSCAIAFHKVNNRILRKEKKDKVFKTEYGSFRLDQVASVKVKDQIELMVKTIQGEEFIIYSDQVKEFKRRYYK